MEKGSVHFLFKPQEEIIELVNENLIFGNQLKILKVWIENNKREITVWISPLLYSDMVEI